MSTNATRIPLADAIREADAFRDLFIDCYERWQFAGSIRRKRQDVGDIEHVVIPRFDVSVGIGLPGIDLGETDVQINRIRVRAEKLIERGGRLNLHHDSAGRTRFGYKLMALEFAGVTHEIYCADARNWGSILSIRTGPADFSKRLVTDMQRHGFRQQGGNLNRFIDGELRIVDCPDELTFFKAAGFDRVIPPEERK